MPNSVQYRKRASCSGISKECADFGQIEAFICGSIDPRAEVAINKNNTSEIFCFKPANKTNGSKASSKIATVGVNKDVNSAISFLSNVNQTNEALVESINESEQQQVIDPSLTSGTATEVMASSPNKRGAKNTSKRAKFNLGDSVRRSTRKKFTPLATWKNQRCIYGTNGSGENIFLGIFEGLKEAEYVPSPIHTQEKIKPLKRKYQCKPKKCSEIDHIVVLNEEGNRPLCAEVVQSHKKLSWDEFGRSTRNSGYQIAKTFDSKSISFGFLELFALQVKPEQCSPEKNIHYCVLYGTVKVELNRSFFLAKERDSFIVPCGNSCMAVSIRASFLFLWNSIFQQ